MNPKNVKIAGAALLVYLVLAFAIPKLLSLSGSSYWALAGGLALIGVLAAVAYFWFEARNLAAQKAAEVKSAGASGPASELAQLLHEAEDRLRASRLGRGARFATLPVAFVIGPRGSTKTTVVMQSGLDPELLAGQVYQEGTTIAPTRFVSAWFARQWIFVEPGAAASADAGQWSRVVRAMRPGQAAGRKGVQSPRAAIVCFDCEEFLKAGGADAAAAAARELREKLGGISQTLGINLPVYVLFTRADRIPFFHDYFHTLTNDEAAQPLGATLLAGAAPGAYDQEQFAHLNAAADRLYLSLAGHRIDFLAREGDAAVLPGAYEFPREFRKMRNLLVQFLLDLCRPSQLTATPFLRGFYFTGVRPVLVRDAAPAPVVAKPAEGRTGATGVFRIPNPTSPVVSEGPSVRRVPQWVFLKQFFSHVLLGDEAALGASAVAAKPNVLKRALLASAAAVGIFLAIAWSVSFLNNRGLEQSAREAAAGIKGATSAQADAIPSLDDLTRLDALRQQVQTVGRYNREGAPLRYRWGLYVGEDLYRNIRRLYFQRFFALLFGSTQSGLLANLQSLPPAPAATDSYQYPYDSLKSYLITTSNHDKSTQAYLAPVLYSRWEAGKSVDAARAQLVRAQFDFYSDDLKFENPFSSANDAAAVQRARRYLAQFAGTERVYRSMLAVANQKSPGFNFNQTFPGSAQTVVNNREMTGAFTKAGWSAMQDAIKNPEKYFNGEQWVLGDQSANIGDRAKLQDDLRKLYSSDYIDQWRQYLKRSAVVGYSSIPDAAKKLGMTIKSDSPLLGMFCMAAQNVDVDPEIAKSFTALLAVTQSSCAGQYIGPKNQEYMKALVALQVPLGQISSPIPPPNDPNVAQAANLAGGARVVTGQMAQSFGGDPLAGTVQKLIEDPIAYVERLVKGADAAALNLDGKQFCASLGSLQSRYPFNPQSKNDATIQDVNSVFQPMAGSLWKFYEEKLQKLLTKQDGKYVGAGSGSPTLQAGFVTYFNRMAEFSNVLYAGTTSPHFTYTLKPVQSEGIQGVTLNIDGKSVTHSGANGAAAQFSWPGTPAGVRLIDRGESIYTEDGTWGVFRFFRNAQKPAGSGTSSSLEWLMLGVNNQPRRLQNGNPLILRFDLEMGASPPVFYRAYFSSLMTCDANVAK
ncbi:MAG TPA: ImcF-related family protein [Bryobacteraceae bacterium]